MRLDPLRIDHLVSQSNPAHLLTSEPKTFKPSPVHHGWWATRVGLQVHLIRKNIIFFLFFCQN